MGKHRKLVGILYIVYGCIHVTAIFTGLVIIHAFRFWTDVPQFVSPLISSVLVVLGIGSVLGIIGGIGILNNRAWARQILLVLGFIYLLNVPLGTILGIYTIWVLLLQDENPVPENQGRQPH